MHKLCGKKSFSVGNFPMFFENLYRKLKHSNLKFSNLKTLKFDRLLVHFLIKKKLHLKTTKKLLSRTKSLTKISTANIGLICGVFAIWLIFPNKVH